MTINETIERLEREIPDSVRRRVGGMSRRDAVRVILSEAPQLYEHFASQAGLPARDGVEQLLVTPKQAPEYSGRFLHTEIDRRAFGKAVLATILSIAGLSTNSCMPGLYYVPPEDKISVRHVAIPGQKNIDRKGADFCFSVLAGKYATYDAHMFYANAVKGIDFDISQDADIYPVADGVIAGRAESPRGGKYLTISDLLTWWRKPADFP